MESLRVDYSVNINGQEELAKRVADIAHGLGHVCMLMPMRCEDEGDYPTMEMFINGRYALGSSSEIHDALENGSLERYLIDAKGD